MTRDQEIVDLYRWGQSAALIGRMYLLTETRVLQILEAHGVKRRKPRPTHYIDLRRGSA